ncbi:MAG TPA: L-threonylcarbamoyladenylate synthase, partial [Thermoanaerobaculia bacterium]|nr:L-threonylcarbamoyladenylate synthase [Thermoanaerobaculia bacterium]
MRRVSIDALNASPEELLRLRELLDNGEIAAVPTETHYALAADPFDTAGVERVFRIKGRSSTQALPVLLATEDQLSRLGVQASPEKLERYFRLWPAPLTVILPIRAPIAASRGLTTLGVRVPAASALRILLASAGPLTGTSANRSGSPPLDDPDAVEALFGRQIDMLV